MIRLDKSMRPFVENLKTYGARFKAIEVAAGRLTALALVKDQPTLDLAVAKGTLEKPKHFDLILDILAQRGAVHEMAYVAHLEKQGFTISTFFRGRHQCVIRARR
jgi:hypothetical protein